MTMDLSKNTRTLNEVMEWLDNVEFEINIESFSLNDLKEIIMMVTNFISYTKEEISCYNSINLKVLIEYFDETIEDVTARMVFDNSLFSKEIAAYKIYRDWLRDIRDFVQYQLD